MSSARFPVLLAFAFGLFLGAFVLPSSVSASGPSTASKCDASTAKGTNYNGYEVTSGFGVRVPPKGGASTNHAGYDLGVSRNFNSFMGGTVEVRQQTQNGKLTGYGNYAIVTNGNLRQVYAHAGSLSLKDGQTISAGTLLGNWSGCSGTCTGDHVHFEYQVKDPTSGQFTAIDPALAEQLIKEGLDPQSPEFAQAAITRGCGMASKIPNGNTKESPMCDSTIRANVAEQVQMAATQKADFLATMATMPRPVSEVANTPCVSNELQRIANQFAYAPTMYSANILGQLSGLAGPVSGLMNNMFGSLFQSVTKAANLNPLAQQFNNFASNTLGSLLSSLGLGGPFSSALCGMMVDMVLKYIQCAAPIKLPDLGSLTGSLNGLLGNDCAGQALTSAIYAASNSSALKSLTQPIVIPAGGLFSSKPLTLGPTP